MVRVSVDAARRVETTRCPACGRGGYELTRYYHDRHARRLAATRGCCRACTREDMRDARGRECAIVLVGRTSARARAPEPAPTGDASIAAST